MNNQLNLYFLNGKDKRQLTIAQQKEIISIVKIDPLSNSFLLFNEYEVNRKIDHWQDIFPSIKTYYPVRCNPYLGFLRQLLKKGVGLSCGSQNQLQIALSLGFSQERILYSNSMKEQKDLIWAEKNGIKITTADSISELEKIKKLAPNMQILWRISLHAGAFDETTQIPIKFGDKIFTDEEISHRMKEIATMNINLKGIHFDCEKELAKSVDFQKGFSLSRRIIQIGRQYGHDLSIVNISGGFNGESIDSEVSTLIKSFQKSSLGCTIVAEPDRFFSQDSFYFLARVIGRRLKKGNLGYFINDSIYMNIFKLKPDGLDLESKKLIYSKVNSESMKESREIQMRNGTIFGQTCDGFDVISQSTSLPSDLKVGDWLCLSGMGAYSYGVSSNFNGMKSQKFVVWSSKIE